MRDDLTGQEVLALARTAAYWPRAGLRADTIRELTVPICLSGVGIQPRVWAHLTNRHVLVSRRSVEVPELWPDKVWAARRVVMPKALWDLIVRASPSILDADESIYVVSPFIASAYMGGRASLRRGVLRNLQSVADAAGVHTSVTWQRLCSSHEAALSQQVSMTSEMIDLRMGRKPKTRREGYRQPPRGPQ